MGHRHAAKDSATSLDWECRCPHLGHIGRCRCGQDADSNRRQQKLQTGAAQSQSRPDGRGRGLAIHCLRSPENGVTGVAVLVPVLTVAMQAWGGKTSCGPFVLALKTAEDLVPDDFG